MSEANLKLANAPIVEAVIDIECNLPPDLEFEAVEAAARECFHDTYPKTRTVFTEQHRFEANADAPPKMAVIRRGIQAFQFVQDDDKQLVQVRRLGFSFNKLAPYSDLDEYLPEIERTWRLYVGIVSPVLIRLVRLRYINRILLPGKQGKVQLDDYLRTGPRLPDEEKLTFIGFVNQHAVMEETTRNEANIVLMSQRAEQDALPVVFDITVANAGAIDVEDWTSILSTIQSLRNLKNRIFRDTLTEQCLKLFL